jgi:membrane protease YdiL (CAAX protease family)
MASRLFGETKGPIVFTALLMFCVAIPVLLFRGSSASLPQHLTVSVALNLVASFGLTYGIWIVALIGFLAVWEKKRSLRDILTSVGFKKEGLGKSIFWALLLLIPAALVAELVLTLFTNLLGPVSVTQATNAGGAARPTWYLFYTIIYAFFPVAIFEEALGRGYLLDRLMLQQPCGIIKALPAIALSSVLFTLFHLPAYILVYTFSRPWAIVLLVANVFPNAVFLSISYVRSRTRNVGGPVIAHFLMDSLPYILTLI